MTATADSWTKYLEDFRVDLESLFIDFTGSAEYRANPGSFFRILESLAPNGEVGPDPYFLNESLGKVRGRLRNV